MQISISEINAIINEQARDDGSLISALEEIQERYRYLPPEALILASERLGVPLSQAYGVATFYNAFSLTPKGKHLPERLYGDGLPCARQPTNPRSTRDQTQHPIW